MSGATDTTLGTRPFRVDGSPYEWSLEASRYRAGSGVPREDPNLRIDTELIPAFGAIFMDLEDLSAKSTSKFRCPTSGDVLSKRSTRKGVLRGSMTFIPGYDDSQMPGSS